MTTEGFDELDAKLERLAGIVDIIEEDVAPEVVNHMRNTAIAMVRDVWSAIDTGALMNSITGSAQIIVRPDDVTVEMGITSSSDHLRYVEFGTGAKGSAEYTSPETGETYASEGVSFQSEKAMWFQHNPDYQGVFGKNNDPRHLAALEAREGFGVDRITTGFEEWIPRYAQTPRPIMRPALYDNLPYVEDLIIEKVKEAFA
jgi:hypothetical protein